MNDNRYIVQKLTRSDPELNLEIWKNTTISSNKAEDLYNFLAAGYRIFDAASSVVIETKKD